MVPLTFLRTKASRSLPIVLAALIFAGCGTQAPDQTAAHMQGTAQADSGYYLQQMSQSSDDTKTNWQLLAIRALLKYTGDGNFIQEHLYDCMKDILAWHVRGTRYGIRVDDDGLLRLDSWLCG